MAEEEEASKVLRQEAPREQEEAESCGPSAPAEFATANKDRGDDARGNKIVITEMEEFVLGLQLNQEKRKLEACDVCKEEDGNATSSGALPKDCTGGLAVIKEQAETEDPIKDGEEGLVKPDEVLHEVAVGKGLAGALQFLKDRGTLNEDGNRTTGKKKRLVVFKDEPKEIRIERTDEFGRAMTPKEAFRDLSHRFHGKHPGKTKQEKMQRKYQDELKTKRMKSSDTPLMSAEKMREAQVRSKTPYLVLSGNASNPRGL